MYPQSDTPDHQTDTLTPGNINRLTPAALLSPFSDYGDAVLRIAAGLFLMPHGAQKLFGMFGGGGLEKTGQFFESQLGYPNGFLAALAAGGTEFFGGLLLAIGLLTRISSLMTFILLLVAASVHFDSGFFWNKGGYEYAVLWALIALSYAFKGGGRFSLDRALGLKF